MPQDAFTLNFLCKELATVFKGGKVNRIIQPSNDQVILTVYTGKRTEKLLLDVNPGGPRIGITDGEKESPLTAPNFCMLLRKHLLSATITDLKLIGFDRIVRIDFLTSDEFKDSVQKSLYVELMGRYSNVILTEDGKILGGNRGINMFDNGVRPLIVGKPYVFPPVGEKRLPTDKELIGVFEETDRSQLAKAITDCVQGIAVSTANEIVRTFSGSGNEFGKAFFEHLNDFLFNVAKRPCVITDGDEVKDVCVYPYQTISGVVKVFDKLYLAEEYYFSEREKIKRFKSKKDRLNSVTAAALKKVKKRLTAINAKEKDALGAELNRIKGELLLANIYRLKNGDKECELDNYYDGSKVKIILDERLTISKNAENYYKRYTKQKRTLSALAPQKEQAESEISYLNSVVEELAIAESVIDLNLIQSELEKAGLIVEKEGQKKRKKEQETFCREYSIFSFIVKAGRNNTENDKLTFTAKSDDVWVHVKDYHSSHVVISAEGREVPEKVIRIAAEISAYYSKAREGGKVEVVYTQKKNVKKPPKSKPGFCTYDNFKSLLVQAEKHTEFLKSE